MPGWREQHLGNTANEGYALPGHLQAATPETGEDVKLFLQSWHPMEGKELLLIQAATLFWKRRNTWSQVRLTTAEVI